MLSGHATHVPESEVVGCVDHTLPDLQSNAEAWLDAANEAREGAFGVSVASLLLPAWALGEVQPAMFDSPVRLCVPILGVGNTPQAVILESIETACAAGADEVEVELDCSAVVAGRHEVALRRLSEQVAAAGSSVVKACVDASGRCSSEDLGTACKVAVEAGAGFVSTSRLLSKTTPLALNVEYVHAVAAALNEVGADAVGVKVDGVANLEEARELMSNIAQARPGVPLDSSTFRVGSATLLRKCRDR